MAVRMSARNLEWNVGFTMAEENSKEKMPISNGKSVKSHGTMVSSKSQRRNPTLKCDTKKTSHFSSQKGRTTMTEDKEVSVGSMSIIRTVCFLMSFSVWIGYFAVFLWFIPCRKLLCPAHEAWTTKLNDIALTSNVESIHEESFLFGYVDNTSSKKIAKLALFDSEVGAMVWNRTIPIVIRKVYCKGKNIDEMPCVAVGDKLIAAFRASDGKFLWYRYVVFSEEEMRHFDTSQCEDNATRAVYVKEQGGIFLCFLNSNTGREFGCEPMPCDEAPLSMVSIYDSKQLWFACRRNTKTILWLSLWDTLCSWDAGKTSVSEFRDFVQILTLQDADFALNIDYLPEDKLLISSSYALMLIASKYPFDILWSTQLNYSMIFDPVIGHFTSEKESSILLALNDLRGNTKVALLKAADGGVISSANVPGTKPISLLLVSASAWKRSSIDSALLQTVIGKYNSSTDDEIMMPVIDNDVFIGLEQVTLSHFEISFTDGISISEVAKLNLSAGIPLTVITTSSKNQKRFVIVYGSEDGAVTLKSYFLNDRRSSCSS